MTITTICPFKVGLIGLLNLWGDVIGREVICLITLNTDNLIIEILLYE